MKRKLLFIITLTVLITSAWLFAAGIYRIPVYQTSRPSGPDAFGKFHYRGAIHVHSIYSWDSRQTIESIRAKALKNNLDFVIVTDHNDIRSRGQEGEKDGLLIMSGAEFSAPYGHFLALGVTRALDSNERTYGDYFDKSHKAGGLNILAHPFIGRNAWKALEMDGFDGVEMINMKIVFEQVFFTRPWLIIPAALSYIVNPGYTFLLIYEQPSKAMEFLDKTRKKMLITCGTDDHGFPQSGFLMSQCVNHVLTREPMDGDFRHDYRIILDSIRRGENFIAIDGFARADEFSFLCESDKDGARLLKLTMAGVEWAEKAGAKVFQKGVLIGTCGDLSRECGIRLQYSGAARVEVDLEVPALLHGSQKVSWINAMLCGE